MAHSLEYFVYCFSNNIKAFNENDQAEMNASVSICEPKSVDISNVNSMKYTKVTSSDGKFNCMHDHEFLVSKINDILLCL